MTEQKLFGKLTQSQLDAFLENPLLARLSTAVLSKEDPSQYQPHTTPVWFYWNGSSLFISAFTSTRKVKEVRRNPFIAVLIDVKDPIDGVTAVLMEGRSVWHTEPAFVQEMSRVIYTRYMGEKVTDPEPQSWIVDPENSIIELTPSRVYTW